MPDFDIDPITGGVIPKPAIIEVKDTDIKGVPPPPTTPNDNLKLFTPKDEPPSPSTKPVDKDKEIKETLREALASITISEKLEAKKADILTVFKTHGMDSMQQIKAWDELTSILTLE